MAAMKPKVLVESDYGTSSGESKWRIVQNEHGGIIVEVERDKDAMGQSNWTKCKSFNVQLSAEDSIIRHLLIAAKLIPE